MQTATASHNQQPSRWHRFFNNGRALGTVGLVLSCLPVLLVLMPAIWLIMSPDNRGYIILYGIFGTVILIPVIASVAVNLAAIRIGTEAVKQGRAGLTLGIVAELYMVAVLDISSR